MSLLMPILGRPYDLIDPQPRVVHLNHPHCIELLPRFIAKPIEGTTPKPAYVRKVKERKANKSGSSNPHPQSSLHGSGQTEDLVTPDLGSVGSDERSKKTLAAEGLKRCTKCSKVKPYTDYPRHSDTSDGRAAYCIKCKNVIHAERKRMNAAFHLKHQICTRIINELKGIPGAVPNDIYKNVASYLGYSLQDLAKKLDAEVRKDFGVNLLESFEEGFHLDHTMPHKVFMIKAVDSPSFKECWAISNLKMVPAKMNLAKGSRVIGSYKEVGL